MFYSVLLYSRSGRLINQLANLFGRLLIFFIGQSLFSRGRLKKIINKM